MGCTSFLCGQDTITFRVLEATATPRLIDNGTLKLNDSSLDYLFANHTTTEFFRPYSRADNFEGIHAEYLQTVFHVVVTANGATLAQTLQSATAHYEDVDIYNKPVIYLNSIELPPTVDNNCTPYYPNDPFYGTDLWWPLEMLCMPEVFCEQTANASVKIAIVDRGYRNLLIHPDVSSNIVYIESGVSPSSPIFSNFAGNHGLASTLAAGAIGDNSIGIAGTGWGAGMMIFDLDNDFIIDDWMEAYENGADIISNSWQANCGNFNSWPAAKHAIDMLVEDYGVKIVFAASNGSLQTPRCEGGVNLYDVNGTAPGFNGMVYPASWPSVISVGGITAETCIYYDGFDDQCGANDETCQYQNHSPSTHHYLTHNEAVDVVAPGFCVISGLVSDCDQGGTINRKSTGASISAPMIAGVIAQILTVNPCLDRDAVMDVLKQADQSTWVDQCWHNTQVYDDPNTQPSLPCTSTAIDIAKDYAKYRITQPTVWNSDRFVRSLTIEAGGELIISGATVDVGGLTRIKVENGGRLIVDNSTIRAAKCHNTNNKWSGIAVHGNVDADQPDPYATTLDPNKAGVLIMRNGSTLEDIKHTAIKNYNAQNWYVENGGLIVVEDCSFSEITRIAEFLRYNKTDNSSFTTNVFTAPADQNSSALGLATSIWHCDGITFDQNYYEGYERAAIYTLDATINVINNNQFVGNGVGVKMLASNIFGSGGVIEGNSFSSNDFGVEVVASGVRADLLVNDNTFFQDGRGLSALGASNMLVFENSFDFCVSDGVSMGNTDFWISEIMNNSFANADNGIRFYSNCSGSAFTRNCFLGMSNPDVTVEQFQPSSSLARLFPTQGNGLEPANNCFTNDGIDIEADQGDVVSFSYFANTSLTTNNCLVPENNLTFPGTGYQANYTVENATSSGGSPCANANVPDRTLDSTVTHQEFYAALNDYFTAETSYLTTPNQANAVDLAQKQALVTFRLRSIIEKAFVNDNLNDLKLLLAGVPSKQGREWYIDAAIQFGDSTEAASSLVDYTNSFGTNSFSTTREIAIDLLGYDDKYTLDSATEAVLDGIYQDDEDSEQGIAGSLLDFLELSTYHFPVAVNNGASESNLGSNATSYNVNVNEELERIKLYPNPTSGLIIFEMLFAATDENISDLTVMDHTGRRLLSQRINDQTRNSVNLSEFPSGIYYLRFTRGDETLIRKVAKQ
ncbi:hypothetical protein CEQ90_14900 [Lewinellaceae bacterium SD302]|nr:hypothetical protein CEQ90_14900 [Lewinellaceae bacterium SD302]